MFRNASFVKKTYIDYKCVCFANRMMQVKSHCTPVHSRMHSDLAIVSVPDPNQPQRGSLPVSTLGLVWVWDRD